MKTEHDSQADKNSVNRTDNYYGTLHLFSTHPD